MFLEGAGFVLFFQSVKILSIILVMMLDLFEIVPLKISASAQAEKKRISKGKICKMSVCQLTF